MTGTGVGTAAGTLGGWLRAYQEARYQPHDWRPIPGTTGWFCEWCWFIWDVPDRHAVIPFPCPGTRRFPKRLCP